MKKKHRINRVGICHLYLESLQSESIFYCRQWTCFGKVNVVEALRHYRWSILGWFIAISLLFQQEFFCWFKKSVEFDDLISISTTFDSCCASNRWCINSIFWIMNLRWTSQFVGVGFAKMKKLLYNWTNEWLNKIPYQWWSRSLLH